MNVIDNEGVACVAQPRCVRCGANGRLIHANLRDHLHGAPGLWNTMRCLKPDCGLAWLDPQPLPAERAKLHYPHDEQDEIAAGASSMAPDRARYVSKGFVAVAKQALRRLVWWRRFWFDTDYVYLGSGTPGRLLDVECGPGDYLRVAKAVGWEPVGLDSDAHQVAQLRESGIEAHHGDLLSAEFPDASFDAVTFRNVLESQTDPIAVFAECHRILKPGGRMVVMTPNIEAYCHYIYGDDWRGLDAPRNRYLFSAAILRRFAKKAGFGHTEAFSQFRNERGVRFMAEESELIASRAGREHWEPSLGDLGRKAAIRAWLGIARGEWVHLVAEK